MARFHSLEVAAKRQLTPDAAAIDLAVPRALRDDFRHTPGQYLTLRANIAGEDLRRCYSICTPPGARLRIGVKRLVNGRFSSYLVDQLQPGMRVQALPPQGRFTLAAAHNDKGNSKQYAAFAAGAGITPVLSLLRAVLDEPGGGAFTLFYGNTARAGVMFRDDLADLKDRFAGRFQLFHLLSREPQDVELLHGRLDPPRITRLAELGLLRLSATEGFFICGPGDMVANTVQALRALGVAQARIRTERFVNPGVTITSPTPPTHPTDTPHDAARVQVIVDGATRRFSMRTDEPNIIDAAARSGLDLPHACKGGMCCTCRCKVVRGRATMALNYSLEPWELDAGYILACQSRPQTQTLTLDFDSV